jgi:polar amino acid transport system permease protein
MNLSVLAAYWPVIFGGLWTTARICFFSILLGLALGLAIELARQHFRVLRLPCRIYIEFFRGSPILIQLFLLYYAGPGFGLVLDPEAAGVAGLGLYGAAYFAEVYRSGFESIPRGQLEAAACLGIGPLRTLLRIKLPQMTALVLPPMVNQAIILIKDSAVLSIITVPELTKVTAKIINETFSIAEPLLVLALFYWLLVTGLSGLGAMLEGRLTRHLKPAGKRPC